MPREKTYLHKIQFTGAHGDTMTAQIDYLPDRIKPWTVRVDLEEASPAYATIGAAQAYLRKHYFWDRNPNSFAYYYIHKSILFKALNVKPCDQ